MSVDLRSFIEGEEHHLRLIPFGRNRFLRAAGVALFTLATQLVAPRTVLASPPWPCYGNQNVYQCPCCQGAACCSNGCITTQDYCPDVKTGAHCWYTAIEGSGTYECCDWVTDSGYGDLCICVKRVCSCW